MLYIGFLNLFIISRVLITVPLELKQNKLINYRAIAPMFASFPIAQVSRPLYCFTLLLIRATYTCKQLKLN